MLLVRARQFAVVLHFTSGGGVMWHRGRISRLEIRTVRPIVEKNRNDLLFTRDSNGAYGERHGILEVLSSVPNLCP